MIKKFKKWIENIVRKTVAKILQEEYYISADVGIKDTEIMVIKYSYRTGRIEVMSDCHLHKTPLTEIEKEIRHLSKKYNASIVRDYPIETIGYTQHFPC